MPRFDRISFPIILMTNPAKKSREMRIRKVPINVHRSIVVHQKIMSRDNNQDVSIEEAAIDLLEKAILGTPHLK